MNKTDSKPGKILKTDAEWKATLPPEVYRIARKQGTEPGRSIDTVANTGQQAWFTDVAAKAVLRDVARVLEWPYSRADELAKLIPFQPGKTVTLKQREDPNDTQSIYLKHFGTQIGIETKHLHH